MTIRYGFHTTPMGLCLIGIANNQVSHLAFIDPDQKVTVLTEIQQRWYRVDFIEDEHHTKLFIDAIFNLSMPQTPIQVLFKGTEFQIKVWTALLAIPLGQLVSYQAIAGQIGQSKAVRAVATAIANNNIAYLIPCHRVINKSGKIGQYRWGSQRKIKLIDWELGVVSL